MAVSEFASGTQTATLTTEHSLASVNVAGVFRLWVDCEALAAGDVVELRVKGKALAGGTKRGIDVVSIAGVQVTDRKLFISDAYDNPHAVTDALEFTLLQTFGTGRVFPWSVRKTG
jgi:hypothetical protein